MPILTTYSTTLERLVPEKDRNASLIKIAQSMSSRHLCLCCSNPLLRHICLGKLYWRCNYCYQGMPVMEDTKVVLSVIDEEAFPPLLIFSFPLLEPQHCEQKMYWTATAGVG